MAGQTHTIQSRSGGYIFFGLRIGPNLRHSLVKLHFNQTSQGEEK